MYTKVNIKNPRSRNQKIVPGDRDPAAFNQSTKGGFTLLEILLSIFILAIVVTTVLASFNSVFSTTEALDSSSEIYEMAKNSLKRMTVDLESIYIAQPPLYKPPGFDDPPDQYRIVGSTKDIGGTSFAQIRFASKAHVRLEKSIRDGIAEIIYYVQAKDDGDPVLKRADNLYPYPPFEEKGVDPVLCKYVKSLAFKYYDEEGSEYDVWDSDSDEFGNATPTAIMIQLELSDKITSHTFQTLVKLPLFREKIE